MKKYFYLFLALIWASNSFGQSCGVPLGSSGGQQVCYGPSAFVINFSNETNTDLGIWWNYFTDCTDHLLPSPGPVQHIVPSGVPTANRITHKVPKIKTDFGANVDNSDCDCSRAANWTSPCYIAVEFPGSQFTLPIPQSMSWNVNATWTGGTFCGWNPPGYGGPPVCVSITILSPNEANIDFHY